MRLSTKLRSVLVFARISTRRFFRDRTALFFTIGFPLIFLFIFGGLFGNSSGTSFKVGVLNQSQTAFSKQFSNSIKHNKIFKVNTSVTSEALANTKMSRGEIDATIVLPPNFGATTNGVPHGQALIRYTQNSQSAATTLESVLQSMFANINAKYTRADTPLTVASKQNNERSLSQFDYTFTGLLGFAILGLGIFGPMNVFPELKKMGILRRLHTTPLRVWQYFLATMISQAIIGLISVSIMLAVAISIFHLKLIGNPLILGGELVLGIVMILGIGLAIGGWASNERQAAPIGNLITFPMMFLSGAFFPRFLMPDWLQSITTFMPLTPVIDGARLVATEGRGVIDIAPQLGLMAAWTVIIYLIAFRVFRWE